MDREDREDGRREPIELVVSDKSASGYQGVHRTGVDKWQTQVYHNGTLYHVGHNDQPQGAARTHCVCKRFVDRMRHRGVLPPPPEGVTVFSYGIG